MKKLMSLLLCLCMAVSLAAPAFASEGAEVVIPVETIAAAAETTAATETETPAEAEAPVEETPAEEMPAEEVPAEETTGEETPTEQPTVEENAAEVEITDADADALLSEETTTPREDYVDDGSGTGTGEETPDREKTPVPDSGTLTDTISWTLDEDYVLTISGTGEIPDFEHSSKTPWADHRLSITKILIGEGITGVGDYTFDYCSNVTTATLPSTLVSIGEYAFGNGATGTTIEFPSGLKTIEKNAFHLNKLTAVHLPMSVTSVGDNAFAAGSIKDITLPNADYGETAFANNPIEIITLEEGLTAIPACLDYLTTLKTLNLPSTLETLDSDFLAANTALEAIHLAPDLDASHTFLGWQDENGHMFTNDELINGNAESFFPSGAMTAVWLARDGGTSGTVEDSSITWSVDMATGVLTISGTGAMPDFASLDVVPWSIFSGYVKKIVIEKGVTTVGSNAFESFMTATEVSLPEDITAIGKYAFAYCTGLTSISLPESLASIGAKAFQWCRGLTSMALPAVLTSIGQDAFKDCSDLESITMAKNADGESLTCWIDETGTPYANNQLTQAGYIGTLTAFWGLFSDVHAYDWFYDYVMYCYEGGIMNGTNVGIFEPYGGATRAQVVMVLYRLAGEPEVSASSPFSDVPANTWFSDAVIWAAEKGIAKGYGDGTFAPYNYVTREEFLVFLHRFVDGMGRIANKDWSTDYDLTDYDLFAITDAGSISSWAMEAETWSCLIGLQTGYDNGDGTYSLNPRNTVTRAELATFLSRYDSNYQFYVNGDVCQFLMGYSSAAAINVYKTVKDANGNLVYPDGQPDDKIEMEDYDDLVWWCYERCGVMLLMDYSENSNGIIVGWDYTEML